MKLKAVLANGCPPTLIAALESAEFRQSVIERVLGPYLKLIHPGPAEFYIQACDFACASAPMCEVRMTGVSVNTSRATDDLHCALEKLEELYRLEVAKHYQQTTSPCQLFVSMHLDGIPFGEKSSLLERKPVWIPDRVTA